VRVVSEAIRAKLSAWLQLSASGEFRGKLPRHRLRLEQSSLLCWPRADPASRIQVEIHWLRTLLLGSHPGHSRHTDGYCSGHCGAEGGYYASQPGVRLLPLAVAAIVICLHSGQDFLCQADRVLEQRDGTVIEWERQTTDALSH